MKTLILVLFFAASASAQSLADAARKADEARKARQEQTKSDENKKADTTPATKTYTNKDFGDVPPIVVNTAPLPASKTETKTEETPPDTPAEQPKGPIQDEAYWRAQMLPLTSQLTTDLDALKAAERRYAEARDTFDKLYRLNPTVVPSDIVQVERDLKVAQARVTVDQRAIDALMEEGRVAGALPGWFR